VGGGSYITVTGDYATVAGGYQNTADSTQATVAGGADNHAGYRATIGGGLSNYASASYATVPGGYSNTANGSFSFAAGRRARTVYEGCFVWGDATDATVSSTGNNQFIARASGGVYFYTSGDLSTGVYLASGSENWQQISASDRNLKENFSPVNNQEILAQLAQVPITTWNYKASDSGARHMSPMAQDFYSTFGLGEDDKHLGALDTNGVALAAIQGLYQHSQEQAAHIEELEAQNAAQQQQIDDLETRLVALENASPRSSGVLRLLPGGVILLAGLWAVQQSDVIKRAMWFLDRNER
jgi:hypothetical protein